MACQALEALEYASSFLPDREVHAEAELAVVEIGKGTIGAWREKTRAWRKILEQTTSTLLRQSAQE